MNFPDNRNTVTLDGITYAPGRRFRVTASGVRLIGMVPGRGGYGGWQQELHPGDIVTCTGYGPGFGMDLGMGVEFTTGQSDAARASHCDIWPQSGSIWDCRPAPGTLEPVEEES